MERFPGLLFCGGGAIAIHADWPNYPVGEGYEYALQTLGSYPKESMFFEVSDIDRCLLLMNKCPKKQTNPFDPSHHHCAIWHIDLINLLDRGFISGIKKLTEYQFNMNKFESVKSKLAGNYSLDHDGNLILNTSPQYTYFKPDIDEEFEGTHTCASVEGPLFITEAGWVALERLLSGQNLHVGIELATSDFIAIGRYDTAIREAALLLESNIKASVNGKSFGHQLIESHIKHIVSCNQGFKSSSIKAYRNELRTVFSFVRNDFMHNFKEISKTECLAILARISRVYTEFKKVTVAYSAPNT